jgi:hypothetical protein
MLVFELNPQSITRTRSLAGMDSKTPGVRGYDFAHPSEASRAAQGISAQPESFTLDILLDATDRMKDGDPVAAAYGIQPELDTLRTMIEPKTQGPKGVQLLASLGVGSERAHQRDVSPSVLLFVWGGSVLPVFLTSVRIEEKCFLPSLKPYRAAAALTLQVVESANPFYLREKARQLAGTALQGGRTAVDVLKGVL